MQYKVKAVLRKEDNVVSDQNLDTIASDLRKGKAGVVQTGYGSGCIAVEDQAYMVDQIKNHQKEIREGKATMAYDSQLQVKIDRV